MPEHGGAPPGCFAKRAKIFKEAGGRRPPASLKTNSLPGLIPPQSHFNPPG
jgi:hypothetical protein